MLNLSRQNPLTEEVFVEPIDEVDEDNTFQILLLTVGCLLIVVSGLVLANTWVTRKQLAQNTDDHDALVRIRLNQRQNEEARLQQR